MLQKSSNVETKCSRRWSLLAGGGLLVLGFALAGFHLSSRDLKAEPAEPKKSIEDIEREIQKGLESLKKGAEPKKDDPSDLNPIDAMKKAEDALKKAQQALRDDPKSEDARKQFDEAVRRYQEAMKNRQRAAQPNVVPLPFPPIQPINPEDFEKEFQRMFDEIQRQMQIQPGVFPGGGGRLIIGGGGRMGLGRIPGDARLGVRLEKPIAALIEQLDLPADKGLVVTQVLAESAAAKVGIKANDIILEVGGKSIPSDVAELQRILREFKADEKIDIVVMRKGKKETLKELKLPEIRPDGFNPMIVPAVPRIPNLRNPNGFPPEFFNGQGGVRSSIQVTNGEFTAKHFENGINITVVGTKDDGGAKVTSIVVEEDGKTTKAESIEKLDEKYRPMVEKVLKRIR